MLCILSRREPKSAIPLDGPRRLRIPARCHAMRASCTSGRHPSTHASFQLFDIVRPNMLDDYHSSGTAAARRKYSGRFFIAVFENDLRSEVATTLCLLGSPYRSCRSSFLFAGSNRLYAIRRIPAIPAALQCSRHCRFPARGGSALPVRRSSAMKVSSKEDVVHGARVTTEQAWHDGRSAAA